LRPVQARRRHHRLGNSPVQRRKARLTALSSLNPGMGHLGNGDLPVGQVRRGEPGPDRIRDLPERRSGCRQFPLRRSRAHVERTRTRLPRSALGQPRGGRSLDLGGKARRLLSSVVSRCAVHANRYELVESPIIEIGQVLFSLRD
jgi:hypothetical protein